MATYYIEIDLSSGQVLEHCGVSKEIVNNLKIAFNHNSKEVFTVVDCEGESSFRINDVTAICINEEKEKLASGLT